MAKIVLTITLMLFSSSAQAAVWYVRTDGGTGDQCDGHTDHALASATGTNCALNHPFWVFPPRNERTLRAAADGDTVVLGASQHGVRFREGCQGSATNCLNTAFNLGTAGTSFCAAAYPYDCYGGTVPNNVTIIGCTTSGCALASDVPEMWGSGRTSKVLDISYTSGIHIQDIIITDHSATGIGAPSGSGTISGDDLSGRDGILMSGARNIRLTNVYVHGMWHEGIHGGHVGNITLDGDSIGSTTLDFNALSGWNQDDCNNDGTCGVAATDFISMTGVSQTNMGSISWNGCVESYDGTNSPGTAVAGGCYNGNNGGYGDGFGASSTSGTWLFNYWRFEHNTADGLDLKYCTKTGCIINATNVFSSGNAGNQFKAAGTVVASNVLLEGDCDFFEGKSYKSSGMASCNSLGDAMNINMAPGSNMKLYGFTVANVRGNVAISIVPGNQSTCASNNTLDVQNSVFTSPGRWSGLGGGLPGFSDTDSNCSASVFTQSHNNIYSFSSNPAGQGSNVFTNSNLTGLIYDSRVAFFLSSTSPARGIGNSSVVGQQSTDFGGAALNNPRDAGGFQFGTAITPPPCDSAHCSGCSNQTICTTSSCFWYSNQCNSSPQGNSCDSSHCSLCGDQTTCGTASCFWYNNQCNTNAQSAVCDSSHCSLCSTSTTCDGATCYWYTNQCNSVPQPTSSAATIYGTWYGTLK